MTLFQILWGRTGLEGWEDCLLGWVVDGGFCGCFFLEHFFDELGDGAFAFDGVA